MRTRIVYNAYMTLFLVLILALMTIAHAETNTPKNAATPLTLTNTEHIGTETSKTYTLLKMSGTDGFILKGASAIKLFFLPLLQEWDLDNVSLHFILYRAALSGKSTTVTLLVNDNPVSSLELKGNINDKTPWDVTIPLSLLKGTAVNIKITSTSSDYGYSCYNLTNPSYWVYVTGDSTVTYHYKPTAYSPDLSKFPYPFIKDPSLEKDNISIVLPNQINLDNLSATFYLANALGDHASWRGIQLATTTADRLTDKEKKNSNIIYIGTAKELQLAKMAIQWPLAINTDDKIIDKDNTIINDQTGVILLATSPWNPSNAIMVVTGNSDTAVRNAALMLRDPNFSNSVLFSGYAFIPQTPEIKLSDLDWTNTTFKNLNYENRAVYGNGENSLSYTIHLPDNKIIERLALIIDYSISPFLATTQNSTLTLKVNDLPLGGTILDTNNTSTSHWKFLISGNNLKPGENNILLSFNLKLKNTKCTPEDASLSWAMIYSTSSLRATFAADKPLLNLIKYPTLLNNNLIITIPEENNYFTSDNFLQSLLEIAIKMNKIITVKFMTAKELTLSNAANSNIFFIGNPDKENSLTHYKKQFPFYFSNQKIKIASNILSYLAISDETPTAIIQLIPSPFNSEKSMLMLSSLTDDGYRLGIDLLNNPKKTNLVNGNVALIYQNGTFTSIQSQRLAEYAKNKNTVKTIGNSIFIVFIVLLSLIIIIFITRYIIKRLKNYYSKK